MTGGELTSRSLAAVLAAAVGSSVLAFLVTLVIGAVSPAANSAWKGDVATLLATGAIVLIWAPAIALIPAALLGYFVERPKAKWMIASRGGILVHLALSVLAAVALSGLFRIVLHLIDPKAPLFDPFGVGLFAIIGLGSGLAWWFLVILPGRPG
ncbi:MAG TPA: hypothetical protein VFU87_02125 [Sphingomicrobium sp.]|nr:hypothetical protein [Sphingomicrobium sp.]